MLDYGLSGYGSPCRFGGKCEEYKDETSAWARGGLPGTCATSARVLAPARCPNWIWGVGLLQLCRLTSFIAGVRQVAPAVCRARVARNRRSVLVRIAWRYSIGTLHGVRPVALDSGFVRARLHLDRFFALPIIPYKTLGKPYEKWGSKAATASAVVFVLFNHYQIIAIVGSAEVEVPISCSALTQGGPSPTR